MRIADVLRNKGAAVVTSAGTRRSRNCAGSRSGHRCMVWSTTRCGRNRVGARVVRQLHTHGPACSLAGRKIMTRRRHLHEVDTVDAISMLMTDPGAHVPVLDGKKLSHRQHR